MDYSVEISITQKQIEEYNKLAKKFNSNPEGIFKEKDFKRVIELRNKISEKQKKETEPFPKFKPVPPIPANATPEEIAIYNKKYALYKEITKDLKE